MLQNEVSKNTRNNIYSENIYSVFGIFDHNIMVQPVQVRVEDLYREGTSTSYIKQMVALGFFHAILLREGIRTK